MTLLLGLACGLLICSAPTALVLAVLAAACAVAAVTPRQQRVVVIGTDVEVPRSVGLPTAYHRPGRFDPLNTRSAR